MFFISDSGFRDYFISSACLDPYLNEETGRYHWFDYDFRTNKTGVFNDEVQERRNSGTIANITNRARKFDKKLEHVSFADWRYLLEKNTFPTSLESAWWGKVLEFFGTMPGIPDFFKACLEIQVRCIPMELNIEDLPNEITDFFDILEWQHLFFNHEFPLNPETGLPFETEQILMIIELLENYKSVYFKSLKNPFTYFLPILRNKVQLQVEDAIG